MKVNKLALAVNHATNGSPVPAAERTHFEVDTSDDMTFLAEGNFNWDDLNKLCGELGNSVLEFVGQVRSTTLNQQVIDNLGDNTQKFTNAVNQFFNDIQEFSKDVEKLRLSHQGLSGPITDMDSYNRYNHMAMQYHTLFTELSGLVTPTISVIMIVISEIVSTAPAVAVEEGASNV